MNSFSNDKNLKFIITLGTGKFGSSNYNQITLEGFRATATVDKAGGAMMGNLRAQIFGVGQSDINSVTTLQWKPGSFIPNTVQVYAIDGTQETLVFQGNIINAWGNYKNMPDVFLEIQAQSAYAANLTAVPPRSFKGQVDVATVMKSIADDMKLTFENNGVSIQLNNIYLANTNLQQAITLAHTAGIGLYVDDTILAITAPNSSRGGPIPLLSEDTGLMGFPTFDGIGVNFDAYFNPSIIFGGKIQLQTSIKQAADQWIVTSVSHRLQSQTPNGAWTSTIRGNASGLAIN